MARKSALPITCEFTPGRVNYYLSGVSEATIGVRTKPSAVVINGKPSGSFVYDSVQRTVTVALPGGEGTVEIR